MLKTVLVPLDYAALLPDAAAGAELCVKWNFMHQILSLELREQKFAARPRDLSSARHIHCFRERFLVIRSGPISSVSSLNGDHYG